MTSTMQYDDFDLRIEPLGGREYRVSLLKSPAGEAEATMTFPYGELALKNRLLALENALLKASGRRRRTPSQEEREVLDFGQALFDALLTGEVRSRYDVSWDRARSRGRGLRFRLRLADAALATLPWEFLYNAALGEFLVLSKQSPLIRYLELPQSLRPQVVPPPLRILGMIASPKNLDTLDVDVEKQRLEDAVADLQAKGLVELVWLKGQSRRSLQRAMRRGPWHIFHFIGHGGFSREQDEGIVAFADRNGQVQTTTATGLARLIGDHSSLRLVVLNSCDGGQGGEDVFSSTASILVRRGLPCVVAMQYEITDRAAIEFSRTFYEAIVDGLPIESAVTEARIAISVNLPRSLEWGTPVVFSHAPDGILFDLAEAPPRPDPPPPPPPDPPATSSEKPTKPQYKVIAPPPAVPVLVKEEDAEPDQPSGEKPTIDLYNMPPPGITLPHIVTGPDPLNITWCWVPPGPFTMGSEEHDREKPVHQVDLPGFWIASYLVTNAQYQLFVVAGGYKIRQWWLREGWKWRREHDIFQPRFWSDYRWNGRGKPVVGVSWYEAVAFARWAAATTGEDVHLPTEAQWEKAARGTDGRAYPWGNEWDAAKANAKKGGPGRTTPVGEFSFAGDSPYGATDMAGNVWEWCGSRYAPYPYGANEQRENLTGGRAVKRVLRGGAWSSRQNLCRTAFRHWSPPGSNVNSFGFRLVRRSAR